MIIPWLFYLICHVLWSCLSMVYQFTWNSSLVYLIFISDGTPGGGVGGSYSSLLHVVDTNLWPHTFWRLALALVSLSFRFRVKHSCQIEGLGSSMVARLKCGTLVLNLVQNNHITLCDFPRYRCTVDAIKKIKCECLVHYRNHLNSVNLVCYYSVWSGCTFMNSLVECVKL